MERSKNVSPALAAWVAAGHRSSLQPEERRRPDQLPADAQAATRSTSGLNEGGKTASNHNSLNIGAEIRANPPEPSTDRLNAHVAALTFDQWVEGLNATFAALADPSRYVMLIMLRQGEHSIGALARPHAMSFAAAAKHVKMLERAGLIERRRVGRQQLCSLRPAPLRDAHLALGRWQGCWSGVPDAP
ncbi:ArsR/SmtB family transcription factor [Sphingomonas endolithica]|uniref:ArsR/SmtB family transcription factor n=1 Tax=Sphingomonas endolithica TaxID=2972485 RepID=UPI0021AFA814|nr:metalloregulator ArsR/SmtB family transcription factor [Sphingomonas sp. ZFBP2030]